MPVVTGDVETGGSAIRAIPTPGHSPDMVAFLLGGTVVFSGDTLFKDAVGGGDFEQIRAAVMDVYMTMPPETRVLPGHTDETTIGREWEENPFVRVWRGVEPEGAEQVTVQRRAGDARRLVARLRRQGQGVGAVRGRPRRDRRRLARAEEVAMCFDHDSSPPIPVISGAAVSHEDLVLEASDGNRFAAFAATPDEPSGAGIVILPDVRGLYRFYEELALRFGERGHTAIASTGSGAPPASTSGRTTGTTWSTCSRRRRAGIDADVAAAVAWLREQGARSIFTVGFCFGGRQSWLSAASGHGLAGAIGFYGRPGEGQDGSAGPAQLADRIECPILALQARRRPAHPAEHNAAFVQALSAAGVEHELVTYEGAPHSFFDRKQDEFADASDGRVEARARVRRALRVDGGLQVVARRVGEQRGDALEPRPGG